MANGYQDVLNRIQKYFSDPNNRDKYKYIYGIDTSNNNVILKNKQVVTIDQIENDTVDYSKVEEFLQMQESKKQETPETVETEEILDEEESTKTLNDIKKIIDEKDVSKLDQILSTFAINPETKLIDEERAIGIVTGNTINEAVDCIKNNTEFTNDLTKYDVTGKKLESQKITEKVNFEEVINNSFNNILLYVEAARLKGKVYGEEKILRAKQSYITRVRFAINKNGLSNQIEENKEAKQEEKKEEIKQEKNLELKPNKDLKKAGFADIFILTIIVLVYAVIIINLILRLK